MPGCSTLFDGMNYYSFYTIIIRYSLGPLRLSSEKQLSAMPFSYSIEYGTLYISFISIIYSTCSMPSTGSCMRNPVLRYCLMNASAIARVKPLLSQIPPRAPEKKRRLVLVPHFPANCSMTIMSQVHSASEGI